MIESQQEQLLQLDQAAGGAEHLARREKELSSALLEARNTVERQARLLSVADERVADLTRQVDDVRYVSGRDCLP